MKKISNFLFKIFIFWAFIYFTQNGHYEGELEYIIYFFLRFIFFCILFYGLFIQDIIYKQEKEKTELYETLKKYARKEKKQK